MKVLTVGDPHFKTNNIIESDQMVEKLLSTAKLIEPDFIVVLGDILHRHEKIHVHPLMRAEEMIRLLSEISPTFVLVGNHDRPNNSTYLTNEHPFNAMKRWPNTYIVDDKVKEVNYGEFRFLMVPYVFPGLFKSTLDRDIENLDGVTAIFCHQEFYGAKMGAITSKAGDKWDPSFPLVISGHVHDYDQLQPNLIYVGTPMQHAFGDKSDKTVSLFHFNSNGFTEDRIDLGLTKRIIVYLKPEEFHSYEPPSDKLVKIVVRGDDASLKAISRLEKYSRLKKEGIKIDLKTIASTSLEKNKVVLKFSYRDRFYHEIKSEPNLKEWFEKLFPA